MVVYEVQPHDQGWCLLRDGQPTARFSSAQKAVSMAMHLVSREEQAGQQVRFAEPDFPLTGTATAR